MKEPILNLNTPELVLVVRLRTNNYVHNGRAVYSRTISLLKTQSNGDLEDLAFEPEYDFDNILNLHSVPDGLYRFKYNNVETNFEGEILSCDYVLEAL